MWIKFLLFLGSRSRRIGEVSHHNLFIILQRCMNEMSEMSEFHTPIKSYVLHYTKYAGIESCLVVRAFIMIMIIFILEDVLDSILLVEILALQGSFCLPAKVFLNFIRSITVESDFSVPDYAPKFIRDNRVLILCGPSFACQCTE